MRLVLVIFSLMFLVACSSQTQVTIHNVTLHNQSEVLENDSVYVNEEAFDQELLAVRLENISQNESLLVAELAINNVKHSSLDISLVGVNSLADTCGIRVNDQTYWIAEGSIERVDGLTIRVFEAFLLHSNPNRGACELMIGGSLMELTS